MMSQSFAAFGDNHGNLVNESAKAALIDFLKSEKPRHRIHLGDCFDFAALRVGLKSSDSASNDDLTADTLAGYDFLERTRPTALLLGNHDHRLYRAAAEHSSGLIRQLAADGIARLETFCRKIGCKIFPYHHERGVLRLGKLAFVHGFTANQRSVAEHAQHFGEAGGGVVMGHLHRVEAASGKRHGGATGYCVGMVADVERMTYAQHRLQTSCWQNGFAAGVVGEKDFTIWQAKKISGRWLMPVLKT